MTAHGNSAAIANHDLIDITNDTIFKPAAKNPVNRKSRKVELVSKAKLPTRFGVFTIYGFLDHRDGKEHTAMVHGDVKGVDACPVRIHSECHTGDIWFSLRCDCREQLEASLKYVKSQERGVIVYLRQEGRGSGNHSSARDRVGCPHYQQPR